jgi:hypothetical protein
VNDIEDFMAEDGKQAPAPPPPTRRPAARRTQQAAQPERAMGGPKTVRIILEENETIPPTGLYVGHNGRGYLIRAGEPVDVPEHIIEILDHAVMEGPVVDSRSSKVIGYRPRMRYPYRRV